MQISATLLALATVACASPTPLLGLTKPVNGLVAGVVSTVDPVTAPVFKVAGPTVGGVAGTATGLLSSVCGDYSSCNTTVTGKISDMLSNGGDFAGRASVAGWCQVGHCYGGAQLSGSIPAPFLITCDTAIDFCTGFIDGSINQTFVNGPQIELWGWIAPTGQCKNGVCTGSINILGDPAY